MTIRRKFIMALASLLRVKLYNHWSEVPVDKTSIPKQERCEFKGCKEEFEYRLSGTRLCHKHERLISESRIKTGITGRLSPQELGR